MTKVLVIVLVVIGALTLTCVGGGVIALLWLGSKSGPPEGIAVTIDKPQHISAGSDFTIVITIENLLDRERTLKDIDFYDPLLSGATVKSVDLVYEGLNSDFGYTTYTFNQPLPPLSTTKVTFTLSANTPGTYTADLDVSVDSIFSFTTNVETIVIDPAN